MAHTVIHRGPLDCITQEASPGLLWLKYFLPIIDSLSVEDHRRLSDCLSSDATFALNNSEPRTAAEVVSMLSARSSGVSKFGHELHAAWDVAKGDGFRTVLYESTSTTVFKSDAERQEIRVKEFNIAELVETPDEGWKAVELRTYMDVSPVTARAQAVAESRKT